MRQSIRVLIITVILFSAGYQSKAQKIKSLSFAVANESISLPFTRFTPVHPGIEIGASFKEKQKQKSSDQINAYFGFYHHHNLSNAIYLKGEYLFSLALFKTFSFDMFTGLGYMHTFNPSEVYELNSEGEFEKITQFGRAHFIANIGLGLSYLNNSSFEPFIKYSFMIETPFANGIPVIPHSMYLFGFNYKINKNDN